MKRKIVNTAVAKTFKGLDKDFVNELARLIIQYSDEFEIKTKKQLAIFLANVKAEIGVRKDGTVKMRENMNYSEKSLRIFKAFRKNPQLAKKYGRNKFHKANQEMIANIAYAKRLGNRGVISGDGNRYKGTGVLQSTGRDTIKKDARFIEKVTGMKVFNKSGEVYKSLLDSYTFGVLLGLAYWRRSGMYKAKNINNAVDIINKYTASRKKRIALYKQIRNMIG